MKNNSESLEMMILNSIYDEMQEDGVNNRQVHQIIDNDMLERINRKNTTSFTFDNLEKASNSCLANQWIKPAFMGAEYLPVNLTDHGQNIVLQYNKKHQEEIDKTFLKKISDKIEYHKGIDILLTRTLSIIAIVLSLYAVFLK